MPYRKQTYIEKRQKAYGKHLPITDQLDAILKAFDQALQEGADLPYELIDVIEKWQTIKAKYPKK